MELEIVEKGESKLKVKIIGEGHSFCNALRKKLHEEEAIETAAYQIDHPLLSDPVLTIRVKNGESAEKVLRKSVDALSKDYDEVLDNLEKVLKK